MLEKETRPRRRVDQPDPLTAEQALVIADQRMIDLGYYKDRTGAWSKPFRSE